MKIFASIGNGITFVNTKIARYASYLIYPIIAIMVFEVLMRYIFNSPSPYSQDLTWMMYGALIFLGGAYALADNVHVKADILYNMLKRRGKLIINIFCYPAFFFTGCAAWVYSSYESMVNAYMFKEISRLTFWGPVVWPIKTVIFIAFVMLTLQGIVKFIQILQPPERGGVS